jgi:hypothetical protein
MKIKHSFPMIAASVGSAAFFLCCSCSKSADSTTTVQATRSDGSVATVTVSDSNVAVGVTDAWDRIKDFSFDRRADFYAGIDRMSQDMDDKTAEFRAKVSGVPDAVSRDRDSAMKEYDAARTDLRSKRADLDKATADTWSDAKAKTAESWKSVKVAYDKVTKANAAP